MSTNAAIPVRILEEAYRLAKEAIFHGGVDWAAGDIAKALAAAEQRGREMEREECLRIVEGYDGKPCWPSQAWTDEQRGFFDAGQLDATASCATAIRSRSEGKGE